jgi:small subunit ribosomal protein S6e
MAKFKLIVSDPATGKCSVSEIEGARAQALIGRSLGEVIDGSALGITQGKAIISGGCDKNGIPMRADVHGGAKKYIVLSSGTGFQPKKNGERRRKLIRGRVISDETYQINFTLYADQAVKKAAEAKPEPQAPAKPPEPPEKEKRIKKEKETKKPAKKGKR